MRTEHASNSLLTQQKLVSDTVGRKPSFLSIVRSTVLTLPGKMSELRRVQLAHEGMRMLLCSELKQAEDLFKASR